MASAAEILCGYALHPVRDELLETRCEPSRHAQPSEELIQLCRTRTRPLAVEFSGGIDSSLVLAAAVMAARRDGTELPMPVTLRFPGIDETDEVAWQKRVIDELGLTEWLMLDVSSERDLVGPLCASLLHRYGICWPATAVGQAVQYRHLSGYRVLTGMGGDEILGARRTTDLVVDIARLRRRDWKATRSIPGHLMALLPTPSSTSRRDVEGIGWDWVRQPWRGRLIAGLVKCSPREPLAPRAALTQIIRSPLSTRAAQALNAVAADHDVELVHPLQAPSFVDALSRRARIRDLRSRNYTVSTLLPELTTAATRERRTKAWFDRTFFSDHTHRFAQQWDPPAELDEVVDTKWLRSAWLSEEPPVMTCLLLQAAFMNLNLSPSTLDEDFSALAW